MPRGVYTRKPKLDEQGNPIAKKAAAKAPSKTTKKAAHKGVPKKAAAVKKASPAAKKPGPAPGFKRSISVGSKSAGAGFMDLQGYFNTLVSARSQLNGKVPSLDTAIETTLARMEVMVDDIQPLPQDDPTEHAAAAPSKKAGKKAAAHKGKNGSTELPMTGAPAIAPAPFNPSAQPS